MAKKVGGKPCIITEQIISDASGLTFQFEVKKGYHGGRLVDETVLRIFGETLPFGNREIVFGPDGLEAAAGTSTRGLCRPSWLEQVDP